MRFVLRALVVLVVLVIAAGVALWQSNPALPGTAEMRAYFAERKSAFERHHAGVQAAVAAKRPVDTGRNDDVGYALLMRVSGDAPGVIYITHTRGFGLGMSGTGVARLEAAPEPVYSSIEAMVADARAVEGFTGFAPVGGDWYVVLWEVD